MYLVALEKPREVAERMRGFFRRSALTAAEKTLVAQVAKRLVVADQLGD